MGSIPAHTKPTGLVSPEDLLLYRRCIPTAPSYGPLGRVTERAKLCQAPKPVSNVQLPDHENSHRSRIPLPRWLFAATIATLRNTSCLGAWR